MRWAIALVILGTGIFSVQFYLEKLDALHPKHEDFSKIAAATVLYLNLLDEHGTVMLGDQSVQTRAARLEQSEISVEIMAATITELRRRRLFVTGDTILLPSEALYVAEKIHYTGIGLEQFDSSRRQIFHLVQPRSKGIFKILVSDEEAYSDLLQILSVAGMNLPLVVDTIVCSYQNLVRRLDQGITYTPLKGSTRSGKLTTHAEAYRLAVDLEVGNGRDALQAELKAYRCVVPDVSESVQAASDNEPPAFSPEG